MEIGDKIRDVEDGDCYFEGIVVSLNPITYKITSIVWCNEIDDSMNGEITELRWWRILVLKDGRWIAVN